jgi:hypothetical protein
MPAGQRTVSIVIQTESGAAVDTQQIKPDVKGNYTIGRPAPAKAGTYQVMVTAHDGRGTALVAYDSSGGTAGSQQLTRAAQSWMVCSHRAG